MPFTSALSASSRRVHNTNLTSSMLAAVSAAAGARDAIVLPDPNTTGGKPLMQALKESKSARECQPAQAYCQTNP